MDDFIRCPSCHSANWEDLHAIVPGRKIRFRCVRCGYLVSLGECRSCGKKDWQRMNDLFLRESKKPVVRYECLGCSRRVALLVDKIHFPKEEH